MKDSSNHADKSIIFFDGVCNLCEGFVQWIIRRDPHGQFYFSSLQSDFAQDFFQTRDETPSNLSSVLLYHNKQVFTDSDVSFLVVRQLGFPWAILYPLRIVPRIIRDNVYRWVAGNRYKWFGKKEQCMIPTPELSARFLD